MDTEVIAIKILEALKVEMDQGRDLLNCKTMNDLGGELMEEYKLTNDEMRATQSFLMKMEFIESLQRKDGLASRLSKEGLAFLVEMKTRQSEAKADKGSIPEKRKWLYTTIFSALAIAATIWGIWMMS